MIDSILVVNEPVNVLFYHSLLLNMLEVEVYGTVGFALETNATLDE